MKRATGEGDDDTAGRGGGGLKGDDSHVHAPAFPGYRLMTPVARTAREGVWRARRVADGVPVAIKVFAAEDAGRVAREAEIAATIEHPHVVAPLEVVFSDGAAVGVVLPWYDDGSLGDLIAVRRRLRWREVLTVLIPLADALATAHERGFVHGDLSLANVLFDPVGRPMLSDFGASRAATEAGAEVYATACDVAPEIVRGGAPSPATDLFSLGSVALACLTGRSAWFADDLQDVLIQSTAGQWPDLEDNMAPPALRVLVRRLLAPEAADRGSAAGLAVDLRRVGEPEPVELVPFDETASPGAPPLAPRAATMVRPDALRPPADDWQPPPHPARLRVAALLGTARRLAAAASGRLSWRGAAATGLVAALAWGAMALGWASAASPAQVAGAGAGQTSAVLGGPAAGPGLGASPTAATPSMTGGATPTAEAAASQPSAAGSSAGASPRPAMDTAPDPRAMASDPDWLAVMVRLDAARAAAFIARDPSLLGDVYVPGAQACRDDETRIAALRDAGARVEQAAHEMLSARLVGLDPDGGVTLDVRQAQDSYAMYDMRGRLAGTTPPVTESVRRVYLRPAEGGFRIVRIEERGAA